jgi:penicillin-binding protein 1C
MAALFKKAGLPLRQPPAGSCDNNDDSPQGAPSIVSPLRAVVHMQRLNQAEPIYLRAEAAASTSTLHWFVDNALVGSNKPGETLPWNPPEAGKYLIRVVDDHGSSDSRQIEIELTE